MPLKSEPVLFWDWLAPVRAPVGRRLSSQQWPQPLTILGGNSPRTEQFRCKTIIIIIMIIIIIIIIIAVFNHSKAFYSTLKGEHITKDEYEHAQNV